MKRKLNRRTFFASAAVGLLSACARPVTNIATPAPAITPTQPITPTPVAMTTEPKTAQDWQAELKQAFATLPQVQTDATWQMTVTPPFALQWPPTPNTTWVRYVYATRIDIQKIADAAELALVWAEVRQHKDGTSEVRVLRKMLLPYGTQGVRPLSQDEANVFAKRAEVESFALSLTAAPDPSSPNTKDLLAFYRTWVKTNEIYGVFQLQHSAFAYWLDTQQAIALAPMIVYRKAGGYAHTDETLAVYANGLAEVIDNLKHTARQTMLGKAYIVQLDGLLSKPELQTLTLGPQPVPADGYEVRITADGREVAFASGYPLPQVIDDLLALLVKIRGEVK
jgi:hypothetical protein